MVVEKSEKKLFTCESFFYSLLFLSYHALRSRVFAEKYWDWSNGTYITLWWFQRRSPHSLQNILFFLLLFFYYFKSNQMLSNCAENHLKKFYSTNLVHSTTQKRTNESNCSHHNLLSISFYFIIGFKLPSPAG